MDNESDNHTSYLFYGFLLLVFGDEDDAVMISVICGSWWHEKGGILGVL